MRKFKGSSDFLTNASPSTQGVQREGMFGSVGSEIAAIQASNGLELGFASDSVMIALDRLKEATPNELAALLKTDAGNISPLLDVLEDQKFVLHNEPAKQDEESKFSLSEIGKRLLRYRKMTKSYDSM